MEAKVSIKWNEPKDQDWLCPQNIEIALSAYCKNTKFEVTEIEALPINGVVDSKITQWISDKESKKAGSYLCFMENCYVKMCYWDGQEWADMWETTLKGKVKRFMNLPK